MRSTNVYGKEPVDQSLLKSLHVKTNRSKQRTSIILKLMLLLVVVACITIMELDFLTNLALNKTLPNIHDKFASSKRFQNVVFGKKLNVIDGKVMLSNSDHSSDNEIKSFINLRDANLLQSRFHSILLNASPYKHKTSNSVTDNLFLHLTSPEYGSHICNQTVTDNYLNNVYFTHSHSQSMTDRQFCEDAVTNRDVRIGVSWGSLNEKEQLRFDSARCNEYVL